MEKNYLTDGMEFMFKDTDRRLANVYLNSYHYIAEKVSEDIENGNFAEAVELYKNLTFTLERLQELKEHKRNKELAPELNKKREVIETDKTVYIDGFVVEYVLEDSVKTEAFGEDVIVTFSFLAKDFKDCLKKSPK
ncbi:hypothetical protein [Oceanobacillus timonensis]|uniref:hypothetical protein n=1 Tax=Oceanobacillus timonensis TaxID=1926285 RepID=UPI0009B9F4B3|nr:hypothetical protein [Oceanobacillus timonensis]